MTELHILGLYGLLIIVVINLQVLAAIPQLGLGYLLSNRTEGHQADGLARRLDAAQMNCVVGMALFAPAVLILSQMEISTGATLMAAWIVLLARLVYVIVYALGIPGLRTASWAVALVATIYLYIVPFLGPAA